MTDSRKYTLHLSDDLVKRAPYGREQCRILVFHCRYLASHVPSQIDPAELRNAIWIVEESVTRLCQKPLPWCLLRRQSLRKAFLDAKAALAVAFTAYNLDTDSLETDFIKAQQQDHENLKARCRALSRSLNLARDMVAAAGNQYEVRELAAAFAKHATKFSASRRHITDDVDSFILSVADSLRLAANRAHPSSEPEKTHPSWSVSSFEVDFDITNETRLIGRGAFGRVVVGHWWTGDANEKDVAVKGLFVKSGTEADRIKATESFKNEVNIWSCLSHPNILQFLGACLESPNPFIMSELCMSGNALVYLHTNASADRLRLLHDTSLGMIYLHSLGITHGDVKATNILISNADQTPRAVLTDFGLSVVHDPSIFPFPPDFRSPSPASSESSLYATPPSSPAPPSGFFKSVTRTQQKDKKHQQQKQPVGTPRWMAPEVIHGKGLSPASDVYGFGMVGWEVLSVRVKGTEEGLEAERDDTVDTYQGLPLPFANVQDAYAVCQMIVRGERPRRPPRGRGIANSACEEMVWEMVEKCWRHDAAARPDLRWVESVLRGAMKQAEERVSIETKKKKKVLDMSGLKKPWRKNPADTSADSSLEEGHADAAPSQSRPRRPSFLKSLVSVNMNILAFPKTSTDGEATKHSFEWPSRNRDDPRKSTGNHAKNSSNASALSILVASAKEILPSLSRSSSLNRSSSVKRSTSVNRSTSLNRSGSQTRKLRRRRNGSLDPNAPGATVPSSEASEVLDDEARAKDEPDPPSPSGIAILTELFNTSLTSQGAADVIRDGNIIPAILRQLLRQPGEMEGDKEGRTITSGILANLACHGNARAYLVTLADLVPALMSALSLSSALPVQENATRCLYNLSTSSQTHRLFMPRHQEDEGPIFAMSKLLLSASVSLNVARNILGCFTNLSHKESGKSAILSIPVALDALVRTLTLPNPVDDVEDIAKEHALMCLGNLSVDEKGIMSILGHPDLILGLAKCLGSERKSPPMKAQALRCLRNIARSSSDHAEILRQPEIAAALSEVLAEMSFSGSYTSVRSASTTEQKYALHFLHRISGSSAGRAWLKKQVQTSQFSGVRIGLRWFSEHGNLEEQMRAAECLRIGEAV